MEPAPPEQIFIRNQQGLVWGPLSPETVELLIESGIVQGTVEVSRDGLSFTDPGRFPVCPECKEGELTEKKSRYGKMFYSCNRYPQCKFALWDLPVEQPCPQCGFPLLVKKVYKREGEFLKCPKEGCDYKSNKDGGPEK